VITALGTGTGGVGTYTVNISQNTGSAAAPIGFFAALPCSTPGCGSSTNVKGAFDLSAAVGEVNASGVVTTDGGYWPAAVATGTTATLTGSPTTTAFTVTGTPFVAHGQAGQLVQMTSGAQNGVVATCSDNGSTSTLTLYANGASRGTGVSGQTYQGLASAPAAGDTLSMLYAATYDGTNPSLYMHHNAGTTFGAWAVANLKQ
jgi:hypothetical protein